MTVTRVSVGQAGASALADWIRSQISPDVEVYDRWPEPDQPLKRAVSVMKVGRRTRLDVSMAPSYTNRSNITDTQAAFDVQIGSYVQPVQVDVWATTDAARDDILAQLDDALTAGADKTIGAASDDPVRDGTLVNLRADDGYSGTVDCWLDDPEIDDSPDSVQRSEYRATFFGEIRGAFTMRRAVPRMKRQILKIQASESAIPAAGVPYDTTTATVVSPGPPPITKITHGQSSQ